VFVAHPLLAQLGEVGARLIRDTVLEIQRVHAIDADQQHVADMTVDVLLSSYPGHDSCCEDPSHQNRTNRQTDSYSSHDASSAMQMHARDCGD
jgi:hypothetical protein